MGTKKQTWIGWSEQGGEAGVDRDGVKALVLVSEGTRGEEVHRIGGCLGKVDELGHLVRSCLSGRKD